ncbi:MAG: type IX secretion system membrane protein PorP/SprF [Sediminicola sp.]
MKNSHTAHILILLISISTLQIVRGQQQLQFTQYMYNPLSLNSGYASANRFDVTLMHRSQWVGLDGAPTSQALTLSGRTGERIGLGLMVLNDNVGPANQVDINAAFSYSIPINANVRMSLGLNGGFDILNVDWSKGNYADPQDPIFNNDLNNIRPIIGAGAYFYGEKWYAGISTPNFVRTETFNDEEQLVIDKDTHFYLMGGYVLDLGPQLKLKPTTLLKYVEGAPITVDVSANFLIQEKFSAGAAYRFNDAMSAMVGLYLSERFFVGYAYDHTTTALNRYNDGSHEIIIRYLLPDAKARARSPRFF